MESAETVQMIVQPCRMNANMENERPRRVLHKGYVLSFNGIFKIFQAVSGEGGVDEDGSGG